MNHPRKLHLASPIHMAATPVCLCSPYLVVTSYPRQHPVADEPPYIPNVTFTYLLKTTGAVAHSFVGKYVNTFTTGLAIVPPRQPQGRKRS